MRCSVRRTVAAPWDRRPGRPSTTQTVDFRPVLAGELYGPLRALELFNQVRIDSEAETLVWPNGADFDPATLYGWGTNAPAFLELARRWDGVKA